MNSARKSRIAWGLLISIFLMLSSAAAGLMYGSVVTPRDSGLAGPAIVLGYGAIAAFAGLAAGIVLAIVIRPARLRTVAAAAGVTALAALTGFFLFVRSKQVEQDAQRDLAPTTTERPLQPTRPAPE